MTPVPVVPRAGTPTRLFALTTPDPAITLDARTRRGAAQLIVYNDSGRALRARARLVSEDATATAWFRFGDGATSTPSATPPPGAATTAPALANGPTAPVGAEVEWDMAAGDQRTLLVQCATPATGQPGTYKVHVDVWSTAAPEASLVSGPTISVAVPIALPAAEAPWYEKPRGWLTLTVSALVLLGAVLFWWQARAQAEEQAAINGAIATATAVAQVTATAAAQETATAAVATATAIARDGETAAATATAQAQFTRYDGDWINGDNAKKGLARLTIKSDGPAIAVTALTSLVDVIVVDHRTTTPVSQQRSWRQDPCKLAAGCELGKPKLTTNSGDSLLVVFEALARETIVHRLNITATPNKMTLNVVEEIEVDGKPQRVSDYSFRKAA